MEHKQHGWERSAEPSATLQLFLTPCSIDDPQITYETVSNLLNELAEYESVAFLVDQAQNPRLRRSWYHLQGRSQVLQPYFCEVSPREGRWLISSQH